MHNENKRVRVSLSAHNYKCSNHIYCISELRSHIQYLRAPITYTISQSSDHIYSILELRYAGFFTHN